MQFTKLYVSDLVQKSMEDTEENTHMYNESQFGSLFICLIGNKE